MGYRFGIQKTARITKTDDVMWEMGERVKNFTKGSSRPRKVRFANYLSDAAGNEVREGDKVMAIVDGALYPAVVTELFGDGDSIFVDVEAETQSFPYPVKKTKTTYQAKLNEYRGTRCREIMRSWE